MLDKMSSGGAAQTAEGSVEYEEGDKVFEEKIIEEVEVVETGISEADLEELKKR